VLRNPYTLILTERHNTQRYGYSRGQYHGQYRVQYDRLKLQQQPVSD